VFRILVWSEIVFVEFNINAALESKSEILVDMHSHTIIWIFLCLVKTLPVRHFLPEKKRMTST